jgi:hypothetical protein
MESNAFRRAPAHFRNGLFPVPGEIPQQHANHRAFVRQGFQRESFGGSAAQRWRALRNAGPIGGHIADGRPNLTISNRCGASGPETVTSILPS